MQSGNVSAGQDGLGIRQTLATHFVAHESERTDDADFGMSISQLDHAREAVAVDPVVSLDDLAVRAVDANPGKREVVVRYLREQIVHAHVPDPIVAVCPLFL